MSQRRFADRGAAGRALAERVAGLALGSPLVLALPRGGVPVAVAVARRLGAPLDAVIVRKLRVPGHPELAMGAVAAIGAQTEPVRHDGVCRRFRVSDADYETELAVAAGELAELAERYRGRRAVPTVAGRDVVLVDDGLATGATMSAATRLVRRLGATTVVVAVPVAARSSAAELAGLADEVVAVELLDKFVAVSLSFVDFTPPDDAAVRAALMGPGPV